MTDHFAPTALHDLGLRLGLDAPRYTGSAEHERTIAVVEAELAGIPGVTVTIDEFEILRWTPTGSLEEAGQLALDGHVLRPAGAVPYSHPSTATGELLHVPPGEPISAAVKGKVVLRDFPAFLIPYDAILAERLPGSRVDDLLDGMWDRPGFADQVLHEELLAAAAEGALGVVVAFDLPREQLIGYFEPHKGTHMAIPAVFVGTDEREQLLAGGTVTLGVEATTETVTTRNVVATMPGASDEKLVLLTHTDGNTWVQENGTVAVLALARSLAEKADRQRTVELVFTSAHLHISREGAQRYSLAVDPGPIAAVIALEHLGTREIVPVPRESGTGRELVHTGDAEMLIWCVGPSDAMGSAVADAVERHALPRTAVLPGINPSPSGQVPHHGSFGGIGTYFHRNLLPTTSLISGPWSLWASSFGVDAIDFALFRQQLRAVADVIAQLDELPQDELLGDYRGLREQRANGAPTWPEEHPPEVA